MLEIISSCCVPTGNRALFSDESRFALNHADCRTRVYRRTNERYAACCVLEKDRFCWGQVDDLGWDTGWPEDIYLMLGNLNTRRYMDDVLLLMSYHFSISKVLVTFQHDNARSHTALIARQFLAQNSIDVLPWPAVYPELSFGMIWVGGTVNIRSTHCKICKHL